MIINEVEKKINKRLKELELRPCIPIDLFLKKYPQKHRYFSRCFDKSKKRVIFYSRLHDNLDAKEKIRQEITFLSLLKKSNAEIKNNIPGILRCGVESNFEWLEREYVEARPLDSLAGSSILKSGKIIEDLAEKIVLISKTNLKEWKNIKLRKFDYRNYLNFENLSESLNKKEIENFKKMSASSFPLLKKQDLVFCHGDLNLGNILLAKNKKIWIIDWELVHLNSFTYDIAYFWSHAWKERPFRKKLINYYLKTISSKEMLKFKKLFPIVAFYLALGGTKLKKSKKTRQETEKRKEFYFKIIKNSLKGFEKLINT